MPSHPNSDQEKDKKSSQSYMKYAGIATSMFAILFISFYLGNLVDKHYEFEKPYIGLVSLLLAMTAYFYKLIKDLSE